MYFLKDVAEFGVKTPKVVTNQLRNYYGDTLGNNLQRMGNNVNNTRKKIFSKRNVAMGVGGLTATGATMYGGNKLYNHIREKRRKWWEIL